ncbi:MarR family transcriptional regulator [Kitasatospora sp. NPDC052896]|uniref:MarR family transcriptional regulator n=1 Tax=Kitasatospora sp. NPDC052896 TaxID=3364061 RepID=UPI0037C869B5
MKLTNTIVSITTAALTCASVGTSAWYHSWLTLGATMALFTATEIVRGAAQGHQVGVAAYLARHPLASAAQVSSALGLRPRTAASTLSNLVADGLAVRHSATADSDATTFSLSL